MECQNDVAKLKQSLTLDFSQKPSPVKRHKSSMIFDRTLPKHNYMTRSCQLTTPDVEKLALTTPEVAELICKNYPLTVMHNRNNSHLNEEKSSKQISDQWSANNFNDNNNTIHPSKESNEIKKEESDSELLYLDSSENRIPQPINLEDQEQAKLERKRLRNRIAASKCRQRKLERISNLQKKVDALTSKNNDLEIFIERLKSLNEKILLQAIKHNELGCDLNIS
ncbi:Transcription factor AP-1 [Sarcoptes scabiei]|uniref:Transcription factor AP-1 n=1 Tax=Sarcoptes scabiei TaxID=52283 RepID=A0A132AD42_SARSC|nr:Transcription factor AP-1 [Sarcoptes scabiei]KPM08888.1 transcription factor AP-1-like protein [Sarcoptes scabiei]